MIIANDESAVCRTLCLGLYFTPGDELIVQLIILPNRRDFRRPAPPVQCHLGVSTFNNLLERLTRFRWEIAPRLASNPVLFWLLIWEKNTHARRERPYRDGRT
jgi:hypothetical protein